MNPQLSTRTRPSRSARPPITTMKWRHVQDVAGVEYAEPNYELTFDFVPNDPGFGDWQYGLQRIRAPQAWSVTTGSEDVVIAVIDSGVEANHPDLVGKVLPGYNAANGTGDTTDVNGHGTHVAGIAAARTNNGTGIAGIAWKSPILPVKVDRADGSILLSSVVEAVYWTATWAKQNPQKRVVANMSLGMNAYSRLLKEAIDAALGQRIVVVAAMGNAGHTELLFPAAFQGVIAVGASGPNDELAIFSTRGRHISVVAPGVDIMSTYPGGGYRSIHGTSMAAPHVAGAVALLLAKFPNMAPDEAKYRLESTAYHPHGLGSFDEGMGYGRIDVAAALGAESANQYGRVRVVPFDAKGERILNATVLLRNADGQNVANERTTDAGEAYFWFVPPGSGYTVVVSAYKSVGEDVVSKSAFSDPFAVSPGWQTDVVVNFDE